MAQASLVDSLIEEGKNILHVLDEGHVEVTGAFWLYDPESRDWTLVLVTPRVDDVGPREMYGAIQSILREKFPARTLSLADIQVRSPRDHLVAQLRGAVHTGTGTSTIRFSRNVINGEYIEDALIYRLT